MANGDNNRLDKPYEELKQAFSEQGQDNRRLSDENRGLKKELRLFYNQNDKMKTTLISTQKKLIKVLLKNENTKRLD